MAEYERAEAIAAWLPKLADPQRAVIAARAIWKLGMDAARKSHAAGADANEAFDRTYTVAVASLKDLDRLVPQWIEVYLAAQRQAFDEQQRRRRAIEAEDELPQIDLGRITLVHALAKALCSTGVRLDPYVNRFIDVLRTMDRDRDEDLCKVIAAMGPDIEAAVPKLFEVLEAHGVWHYPSHIGAALKRAAKFDAGVLERLKSVAVSASIEHRKAALAVLEILGPAAGSASQL